MLSLAVFAGGLSAHETMFGLAPRTIWNRGLEVELSQHFEFTRHFYSGNNPDKNPRDRRAFMWEIEPAFTYGINRDLSVRGKLPFVWMRDSSKDGDRTQGGISDWHVGASYRFFNHPFVGGSSKAAWFAELHIPTGFRERHNDAMEEPGIPVQHDGNWGLTYGLSASTSSTRHYLWVDFAIKAYTNIDGTGKGMVLQNHSAYAYRLFEVNDHRDFDVIMLVEADFKFQHKGRKNGDINPNSGGHFIHLALGFQMNITNRIELKFGYNYPVYKYLNGRQFYHEGEGMLMFSYLF